MDVSLVLRAASCWGAWGEAMSILKRLRIEHDTAKQWLEQAYWLVTRVPDADYLKMTRQITSEGLCGGTVRLHADDWDNGDSLVMMLWKPPEGFRHLLSHVGMMERPWLYLKLASTNHTPSSPSGRMVAICTG